MPVLTELFLTFAKIGAFTFGGGYAMIPLIEDSCVKKKQWISHDEMMDITVIAESTPGPVAINCATFVGYKKAGLKGACAATLGIVIPSFVIIYAISVFLGNFIEIGWIGSAFKGIKTAVCVLILNVAFSMIKKMQKKPLPLGIMICACMAMLCINIFSVNCSSIVLMLLAGMFGFAVFIIMEAETDGGGADGFH